HLAALPEDQLPSEVRASYGQLLRLLQGVRPMRGEDAISASVRKMSSQEADECAAQIVEIFGLMCRFNVATVRPGSVVQLHSVDRVADDFVAPSLIANN